MAVQRAPLLRLSSVPVIERNAKRRGLAPREEMQLNGSHPTLERQDVLHCMYLQAFAEIHAFLLAGQEEFNALFFGGSGKRASPKGS